MYMLQVLVQKIYLLTWHNNIYNQVSIIQVSVLSLRQENEKSFIYTCSKLTSIATIKNVLQCFSGLTISPHNYSATFNILGSSFV